MKNNQLYPVGEVKIPITYGLPKNTTGQLTQQITLSNGKIIPKGSTVVNNGNAYKATLPDGSVVKWNGNKVTPQQALPAGEKYSFNMINNPGPLAELPNKPASNFAGGKYNTITIQDDLILYRAGDSGGGRNSLGQWFTRKPAKSEAEVRIDSAVKPNWIGKNGELTGTSPIRSVYKIKIPKGTIIHEGPVGNQGGIYVGGQNINQIYIDKPWLIKGVEVIKETSIE